MQFIRFQYNKTPTESSERDFVVFTKPTNNYFGIDITELNVEELDRLERGLDIFQEDIDEALANRTRWLKENGFGSYF